MVGKASFVTPSARPMIDPFGRTIDYLRVSVTDRCDLRCTYCMAETMKFLPRPDVLSLEELDRLCSAFIGQGIRKLRLTGGEPLVRRDFMMLVKSVSRHVRSGDLEELTLTTNATHLARYADELATSGIRRINVSLDSLDRQKFAKITRRDKLADVLEGIAAAKAAGIKIKINTVALRQDNLADLPALIAWAHGNEHDIALIETMPLGDVEGDRTDQFVSLKEVRQTLESFWSLKDLPDKTGGPARYVRIDQTGGRLGFITPMSHNFCDSCNRVRVTCTGQFYLCLGQNDSADLRTPLRASRDNVPLIEAIREGVSRKPKSHDFVSQGLSKPALSRHMSMTGG